MSFQYLTVQIGGMWYGISLGAIIEVLHMVSLADLPETDADVLGLLTLRDHIMPVVDLRVRFHCQEALLHLSTPIVAVRSPVDGQMVGFVVDDVDSVVRLGTETPIQASSFPYITGAVQLDNHVLLLLDIPSFFAENALSRPASSL
jgi:purine-binding chemotaxis protein CheW